MIPAPDLACARLCADSYAPDVPPTDVVGSTEIYVQDCSIDGESVRIAALRGSDSHWDWLVNALALPLNIPTLHCWGHTGFFACAFLVQHVVAGHAARALADGRKVYLTGHSQGGAKALAVAALLLKRGIDLTGVVTFGQPRLFVGNQAWLFDDVPIKRYVHGWDIVPHTPALLNWQHIGEQVVIGSRGNPVTQHYMRNYLKTLLKFA